MRKSVLAAGLAVVGAVAATVVGMTVASAANSVPIQHFTALANSLNGAPILIAQGPIHARAKDVELGNNVERFVFPNGNLRIHHHRIGHPVSTFDPVTCYGTAREHGTYRVVRGTGAYRGVRGHGTYRLRIRFVGCHQNKPPRLVQFLVKAAGPLHR